MNKRQRLLGGGLLLAAALAFFGNREPALDTDIATATDSGLAQPLSRQASGPSAAPRAPPAPARQAAAAASSASRPTVELAILPLHDRLSAVSATGTASTADADRDGRRGPGLFAALSWQPPAAPAVAASGPPPAPTAPALPFRYLGRQIKAGQVEVFLAQGESVHIVRAKTQLDSLYRIDAISPTAISFTYLPLNLAQQLPLGASD